MKKSTPQRNDSDFNSDMKKIAMERLTKGLARMNMRELSMAEMTRLLRRTQGYKIALEELKTKPKRENMKW